MAGKLAPPAHLPKRFYQAVSTGQISGGTGIFLDGKPVRTPAGQVLNLPNSALADMLQREWDAQTTHIDMVRMPATRLAFTALDFVGVARDAVAAEIARYGASDSLCYFADGPEALVERQVRRWGPVLEWAERDLGLHFVRAVGIRHQQQPASTLLRIARMAEQGDDFVLAGLAHAAALFGSAILAFALKRGELDGAAAHDLAQLEEAFQQERWGVDEEAAERAANRLTEAAMLEGWFAALRD